MASTTTTPDRAPDAQSGPDQQPQYTPPSTYHDPFSRLSLPFSTRLPLATAAGTLVGTALGVSHGGKTSALRFRAENAHRLPTTQNGWYFYHKSKSYNTMLGGVQEGARMGLYIGFWTALFFAMEEAVDTLRGDVMDSFRGRGRWVDVGPRSLLKEDEMDRRGNGQADAGSTVLAALGTTGLFSLWSRLPLPTAARTAKTAFKFGLGYGLAQDALSMLRGRRVDYAEWIRGLLLGERPG